MMRKKFAKFFPILVIVFLSLIISYKNFVPSTWLSGWDNLHPEFNLNLNFRRAIGAVWQEYQGVGLLGGMAHASDLPRVVILSILNVFLPAITLRYLWVFAMLVLGPLGVYKLIKNIIFAKDKSKFLANFASLTGSLFYLLNLATVQTFFTPYESFVSFYGLFPWLLFFALNYLKEPKKKNLLIFVIFSISATSAFYVQTLFIVYVVVLSIFLAEHLAKTKDIKNVLKLVGSLFVTNAFWLLPALYFAFTNASVVSHSKINSIATPETNLMNEAYGGIKDVALLKGFWLSYVDVDESLNYSFLMNDWRTFLGSGGLIQTAGLVIFVVSLLGISLSLIRKKPNWRISWALGFLLSIIMLMGNNPPFSGVFLLVSKSIPLFEEIFRSPFTKWSQAAALFYAIGLAFFIYSIKNILKVKFKLISFLIGLGLVYAMLVTVKPVFSGKLISGNVREEIPSEYFELYEFFGKAPKQARVAFFPVQTFWGWNFYSWNYRGSGFLWYGIEQPILDRAFDVWSKHNEDYYQEISTALYGEDSRAFKNVLTKYDVSYALLDTSVVMPERNNSILRFNEIESMLKGIGGELVFSKGSLKVYGLRESLDEKGFVYSPDGYVNIAANSDYARVDPLYKLFGSYSGTSKSPVYYPLINLYSEKQDNITFSEDNYGRTKITTSLTLDNGYRHLVTPALKESTKVAFPATVSFSGETVFIDFESPYEFGLGENRYYSSSLPKMEFSTNPFYQKIMVAIGEKTLELNQGDTEHTVIELESGKEFNVSIFDASDAKELNISNEFLNQQINKCWEREGVEGVLNVEKQSDVISMETKDAVGCMSFKLEGIGSTKTFLKVTQPFRSENSARPHFCVLKEGEQEKCENEEVFYDTSPRSSWSQVTREMILEGGTNYWLAVAGRPPDEEGKSWKIFYKPPEITYYPIIKDLLIKDTVWSSFKEEKKIKLNNNITNLTVSYISLGNEVDFSQGRQDIKNCDIFERGWIEKSTEQQVVSYSAGDGASLCDFKPIRDMFNNKPYLLRFVGENRSGRSIKVYLYNEESQRNDLEALLSTGRFDDSFIVLSWPNQQKNSYTLRLEARSFGKDASRNVLTSINYYPYPVDWLSSFRLEREGGGFSSLIDAELRAEDNSLQVSNVKKTGTYKYIADVEGDGVLVLSQGYNTGWIAFTFDNLSFINKAFPFLFGKKLEHIKYNSWANGWLIKQGQSDVQSVVIIFWPQYLEFAGFGVLLLAPFFFLKRRSREKS
jgi:hypothetical protein